MTGIYDLNDDFDERADLATADETIRKLKAENERLRAALERMARDGCGLVTPTDPPCSETCKSDDDWCWSCLAIKALKGEEE